MRMETHFILKLKKFAITIFLIQRRVNLLYLVKDLFLDGMRTKMHMLLCLEEKLVIEPLLSSSRKALAIPLLHIAL